jgi:hypothetical protein
MAARSPPSKEEPVSAIAPQPSKLARQSGVETTGIGVPDNLDEAKAAFRAAWEAAIRERRGRDMRDRDVYP